MPRLRRYVSMSRVPETTGGSRSNTVRAACRTRSETKESGVRPSLRQRSSYAWTHDVGKRSVLYPSVATLSTSMRRSSASHFPASRPEPATTAAASERALSYSCSVLQSVSSPSNTRAAGGVDDNRFTVAQYHGGGLHEQGTPYPARWRPASSRAGARRSRLTRSFATAPLWANGNLESAGGRGGENLTRQGRPGGTA